jgi:MYXO-CTERM domain-containing protein
MKTVATITCAAGAMLFGGTLGEAHAGVVGLSSTPAGNSRATFGANSYQTYDYLSVAGNPMDGPISFNDPLFGSGSFSQFTSSGFALSAQIPAGNLRGLRSFVQSVYFQVTDDVNVSYSAATLGDGGGFELYILLRGANGMELGTIASAVGSGMNGVHAGSTTLAANAGGSFYEIYVANGAEYYPWSQGHSGVLHEFAFSTVPAPGAVALLGLAGLARRRRSPG